MMSLIPVNHTVAAPLAGVSNSVYRRWAVDFGAGLVFTEMASAEGIRRGDPRTLDLLLYSEDERPIVAQIFDDTAEAMREAAMIVEERGFDGVDINMGCPAKKVVNKGAGAALLRDIPLALDIVEAVSKAVTIPVSVKLRTGWSRGEATAIELIREFNGMGLEFVTLHPRSRDMFFSGKADWEMIARAVEVAEMPIIGNGDIFSAEDASRMMNSTECSAVMIGRASMGYPWIFEQVSAILKGEEIPEEPSALEKIEGCKEYIAELIELFGNRNGTNISKKHIVWFTSGMPGCKNLRVRVFRAKTPEDIFDALDNFKMKIAQEFEELNRKAVRCR